MVNMKPLGGTSSTFRTTKEPEAMSFSTMCRGMPPHPMPSFRNACLVESSRSSKSRKNFFAGWFPGAKEIAEMLAYFEAHTYLGADLRDAIALANRVAGRQPTKFTAWAWGNFAIPTAA